VFLFCIFFISFWIVGWIFRVKFFVLFVWVLGPGGEEGVRGVGYVFLGFFSLSYDCVLFAVLFFLLKKSFVLACRVQGL
jgi:hypothetical protein